MAKRYIYKLELAGDSVIVYRDIYGEKDVRQGIVFPNKITFEYLPGEMPDYIIRECRRILVADDFELSRGYTYGGKSCDVINPQHNRIQP